ncbi:MAG TPA: hypothetical protein PLF30_01345 [Candidatus Moranbacteria bacterium]|jgi:hypothetical protein|nr:hypothetical protein [Candidatus Moranbacteria bacterium]HPX94181.1 hypothetical protein [Candidatus Moranbacteria bacterium]HQB59536.1 hypothetical protein [Candidatus Moranbacteria bacterium]
MKIENFGGIPPVPETYKKQEIKKERKNADERQQKNKIKESEKDENIGKNESEEKGSLGKNIDIKI